MNLSHAIDSVGAHDAQVGHVDPLLPTLLNERHTTQTVVVAGKLGGNSLHDRKLIFCIFFFYIVRDIWTCKKKKNTYACNSLYRPLDGDD